MATEKLVVHEDAARRFLRLRRVAVVGAAPTKGNFGAAIVEELRKQGTEVVAVHPGAAAVDDAPGYPDLASVPGEIEGVLVAVPAAAALDVVRACIDRGVRHVWLFRGIGGPGAVSPEAVALCQEHDIEVVPGACPFMFLEPTGFAHRLHRAVQQARHALAA